MLLWEPPAARLADDGLNSFCWARSISGCCEIELVYSRLLWLFCPVRAVMDIGI